MRKLYWSSPNGNSPPPESTFHFRPFFSKQTDSFSIQREELPPPIRVEAVKKSYSPEKKEWMKGVEKAVGMIRRNELEKVVLARVCILEMKHKVNPFAIASALQKKKENSFLFCLENEGGGFLGSTPELLFSRNGRLCTADALAGTRRRGKTEEEDLALQKELLQSPKDLREFLPVQGYLQKTLAPFCTEPLSTTPISVRQTNNVQHLYSRSSGILKETVQDENLLSTLHPTPALCGSPKEKAALLIRELEPFDRGLYGGTLGWSTPAASEWIVAIRSCMIRENQIFLFSGTGIVEGSDPEEEWEELNQKIKLYDGIVDH